MTHGDDLLRIVLAVHAITRAAALETGNDAPSAQWRTLKLLREHGPQRVGDLATISRVSQPGMTRLVGQLAESGLVQRLADDSDARVSVVGVTAAGEAALEGWLVQLRGALRTQFPALDDEQWQTLRAAADILDATVRVEAVAR